MNGLNNQNIEIIKTSIDFDEKIIDKPELDDYREVTYPRKKYFDKFRYKFPSLKRSEFTKYPINLNLDIRSPLFEENPYLTKRNSKLFSISNVTIDEDKINKGYERPIPSFSPIEKNKYLIQLKKNEKKETQLLKKKYDIYAKTTLKNGGSTTAKFFKTISKNILQNKYFVRNMKNSITENNDKSELFITRNQEISKNNNLDSTYNKNNRGRSQVGSNSSYDINLDYNYQDIIRTEKIIKNIINSNNF